MAIFGTLETLREQSEKLRFRQALDFLQDEDLDEIFKQVKPGKNIEVDLNGRDVFAIFQTYETKPLEEAKMEGHKRYIDVQYIHSGTEQILVAPKERMVKDAPYSEESDVYFPQTADFTPVRLASGMACILYPEDLHAPCISIDAPSSIQKIVIKVAIE